MFSTIKKVKDDSPLNIVTMTEKDWTRLLTEDHITMPLLETTEQRKFLPRRTELASPTSNWSLSWSACRQPVVPSQLVSFLWHMKSAHFSMNYFSVTRMKVLVSNYLAAYKTMSLVYRKMRHSGWNMET